GRSAQLLHVDERAHHGSGGRAAERDAPGDDALDSSWTDQSGELVELAPRHDAHRLEGCVAERGEQRLRALPDRLAVELCREAGAEQRPLAIDGAHAARGAAGL